MSFSFFLYTIYLQFAFKWLMWTYRQFNFMASHEFFGETIAHGSLLGFVLQHLLGWPLEFSMSIVAIGYCVLLEVIDNQELDQSSFLPMLSYGVMGASLILIEKIIHNPSLVYTVLIGDILLVRSYDCQLLAGMLALVIVSIVYYYRPLILILFSKDLGYLNYTHVRMMSFLMNVLIALSVAIAVQAVGILLGMALLTIPSLTAYYFSASPKKMMIYSTLLGMLFSCIGFIASLFFNLAVGPTITLVALVGHILIRFLLAFH